MDDDEYVDYVSDDAESPPRSLQSSTDQLRGVKGGRLASRNVTSRAGSSTSSPRAVTKRAVRARKPKARSADNAQSSRQEGSLIGDVYRDIWRLPRLLYVFLKWPLLAYLIWMAFSYSVAFGLRKVGQAVEPVCHIPLVSNLIPLCATPTLARPLDPAKVVSSQEQLDGVMRPAGQNRDLAKEMMGHEYAVRDLRIRVAASKLERKRELEQQFNALLRRTKDTARYARL